MHLIDTILRLCLLQPGFAHSTITEQRQVRALFKHVPMCLGISHWRETWN
jgi:hypothetical protein